MALRAAVRWESGNRVRRWDYSNVGCWCVSLLLELFLTAGGAVEGAPDGLPLEGHEGAVSSQRLSNSFDLCWLAYR